jgi:glycosyltransferase involved in cell wall biosynthesis
MNLDKRQIAFFLPALDGGGAERAVINLLRGMLNRDIPLDLVLARAEGPFLHQIPQPVRLVNLAAGRLLKAILPLADYLKKNNPAVLISHMNDANAIAAIARKIAGTKTRLMLVEHNTLSAAKSPLFRARFIPLLMKWFYPSAEYIVGVSQAVSRDLEAQISLKAGQVKTIYNPVVDEGLVDLAKMPLDRPWFTPESPPIFLSAGRLTAQKDFFTLIQAFAILRKQIAARLIILGDGELRTELEALTKNLGIAEDVELPGFVKNPYAYMSRANAFILSSRWEGLPTVLIEAMACGCPVISTDCPSGPREILAEGKYGSLIAVGDVAALSQAMLQVLESPIRRDILCQRSMYFSVERAVSEYLNLLDYD